MITYFISLLVSLVLFRLRCPLGSQALPHFLKSGLLFILGQGGNFLRRLGKVDVLTLGGVELGLGLASKLPATLIADQAARLFTRLKGRTLILGRFDFFERLVLILFEPFQSSLDWTVDEPLLAQDVLS